MAKSTPGNDLPLVICTWGDAWSDPTGTVTIKEVRDRHKPEIVHTIGWLLLADEEGVSLVNEYCEDGDYRGRTFIPAAMVRSLSYYSLSQPRKRRSVPQREPERAGSAGDHQAQDPSSGSSG